MKYQWIVASEAFRETFWGVTLGTSMGSGKRRGKEGAYLEHGSFPGFVNPHSSICVVLYSFSLDLQIAPLLKTRVC